jgi:hypothetical protein
MTPEKKALELVGELAFYTKDIDFNLAKKFALISVGYLWDESEYTDSYYQRSLYWNKVKEEIEKL